MRPLVLHASALNDDEYELFTSSITDLVAPDPPPADDEHFEKVAISIREARAWLRGRYPDLPVADLDEILRYFTPGPGQDSALTGGQFFAILRLVLHARNGAELERNLVFVQVHLDEPAKNDLSRAAKPQDPPMSRSAPPTHPITRSRQDSTAITTDAPNSDTNPFHHLNEDNHQPPVHPDRRASMTSFQVIDSSNPPTHHPSNPFVARSKTIHATHERKIPPLPPRKPPPLLPPRGASLLISNPNAQPTHHKAPAPPLPPKVPHLTSALMKQSLQASKDAQNAKRIEAERDQTRILQVLKTSAGRDRSTSPLKHGGSSIATSSSTSMTSDERTAAPRTARPTPALPPRRRASPPPSPSISARSFEQVASAAIAHHERPREPILPNRRLHSSPARARPPPPPTPSRSASRSRSPSRPSMDLPPPPPRHPDRILAAAAAHAGEPDAAPTSPRIVRSKSMHHTAPPVPPPLRRRRPESVQLPSPGSTSPLPYGSASVYSMPVTHSAAAAATTSPFPKLARHMSLSSARVREREREASPSPEPTVVGHGSPMAQFQKTLSGLGPRFDAARYKAEAGLSRRGYVPHAGLWREEGAERLVDAPPLVSASSSEEGLGVDADVDGEGGTDTDDDAFGRGRFGSDGRERVREWEKEQEWEKEKERERLRERDAMKWPVGDGWKPL